MNEAGGIGSIAYTQTGNQTVTYGTVSSNSGNVSLQNSGGNVTVTGSVHVGGGGIYTLATLGSGDILCNDTDTCTGAAIYTSAGNLTLSGNQTGATSASYTSANNGNITQTGTANVSGSVTYTSGTNYQGTFTAPTMVAIHTGMAITPSQYTYFVDNVIVAAATSSGMASADITSCFAPFFTDSSFEASIVGH